MLSHCDAMSFGSHMGKSTFHALPDERTGTQRMGDLDRRTECNEVNKSSGKDVVRTQSVSLRSRTGCVV